MYGSYDDLLRPEQFDWAEEVEESIQSMSEEQSSSTMAMVSSWPFPTSALEGEVYIQNRPTNRLEQYHAQGYLETIDEDDGYESDDELDCCLPENFEMVTPATSRYASVDSAAQAFQMADAEAQSECSLRQYQTDIDPEFHHFNFWGEAVDHPSATPPSHSLAVVMSGPKTPEVQGNLRVHSILRRENRFVDPVVVNLEGTDKQMFYGRSSALQRASTGRVATFYTPHGTWMGDNSEQTAFNVCDTGDANTYVSDEVAVGNGFTGRVCIPSRPDWIAMRDQKMAPRIPRGLPRKMTWQPKPSPLRQSMTLEPERTHHVPVSRGLPIHHNIQRSLSGPRYQPEAGSDALEHVQITPVESASIHPAQTGPTARSQRQSNRKAKKRRPRRRLQRPAPTFIWGEFDITYDPSTYFSFPEPTFSRDSNQRLKRLLKQIWELIKSPFVTQAALPDDGNRVFSL